MGLVLHGALATALLLAGPTPAEPPMRAGAGPRRAPAGVGTIQYDNDVPFSRDGTAPFVGNRFNVGFADPHSIASVSLRRGGAAQTYITVFVLDVPGAVIGSGFTFGWQTTTYGTMLIAFPLQNPVLSHTGSFIVGMNNLASGTCAGATMLGVFCDGPALTAGTLDPGLGFHAVRVYALGTSGIDIPNRNAIVRVSGDNLPVELMGFSIE